MILAGPDGTGIRRRPTEVDAKIERMICIGLVTSDRFAKGVKPLCKLEYFQSNYARKIAQWCLEYFEKFNKAPVRHIEDIYLTHKASVPEEDAELLEDFLASISDEYELSETFNVDYIISEAEKHFRAAGLKNLRDKLTAAIIAGKLDEGENCVKEYEKPAKPLILSVDPLRDIDCIVESLTPEDENPDIIMRLPGALGNALGPLERGFLFAVQAESGVGKTWWLTYMAQLAVFSGHNVVFFSMEMSTKKMVKRIWQSLTSAPIERHGKLLIPIWDCKKNQLGTCANGCGVALLKDKLRPSFKDMPRGYKVCTACKGRNEFEPTAWWTETEDPGLLDPNVALRKQAVLDRSGMLRKAGKFCLIEFPNGKYTTEDMVAAVKNLVYYEGIVPGLIVTDYADKFKWAIPKDPRVSIGKIWREHKAVAQELNCLVASASQSNTMRSGKQVGRGTWGEAIDKIHELDDGASFNQSSWEKDAGIIRASISKRRHGETVSSSEIMILQSLRTGRPYLDSYLMTAKKEA